MWDKLNVLAVKGLRVRLLGIVLLAVIPLVVLLFFHAGLQNDAAHDLAHREELRNLQSDASSLQDLIAESRATLVTFGITYAIQQHRWDLAQGNAERLRAEHPNYAVIAVADPTGRITVSSTGATGTVSIANEMCFKRVVSSRTMGVSGYQVDPLVHRPMIHVSLPVYGENQELVAVEYIGFEFSQLASRLTATGLPGSAELLIDGDGTLLARTPEAPELVGKVLTNEKLVRAVLAKERGHVVLAGLDGVTRDYYFVPVAQEPRGSLYLASGVSETELLADQRQVFMLTLAGVCGFSLLALLVAWLVGTFSIYLPVRKLEMAAGRLSAGELSARSEVSARGDEIGALGREFDCMAESMQSHVRELERTQAELSVLNVDLDTRVRLRTADLEASNKELDAFNYSVSHDLRGPLRAIDGFSQALLEDYGEQLDEEGRDHLYRVKAAANRMGELIDSLLTLSRLTRIEMDIQSVDLSAIASEIVESLRQREPGRDVAASIQSGLVAQCDPVLLHSVLENLLENAWKFTGRTKAARIEFGMVDKEGAQVYFVRDNGAGFDMAYSNKLFGAFQRLHKQGEFPGTGVGLATVSRVVLRHGGRVWAEAAPGKGATFYFTLS